MAKTTTKQKTADAELFNAPPIQTAEQAAPGKAVARPRKVPITETGTNVAKFDPPRPMRALDALAAALKNASDPAKMRELFQLYQDTEGKQLFHEALLKIDFPSIDRDGKIPVSGGKALRFASFENVHKAIMPLLRAHGFRMSFAPGPAPSGEGMVVTCRLIRGTYEESCMVPMSIVSASRAMNSQQAIGAAIKYASRYGVMYLLNLRSEAPEDRDTDGVLPKPKPDATAAKTEPEAVDPNAKIPGPQAKELLAAINECGVGPATFLQKYEIDAVHELPARLFDEAMKACRSYGAARNKAASNG
jgi:hypothetical protein